MANLEIRDLEHLVEVEEHELADIKGGGSTVPVPDYTFLTRKFYINRGYSLSRFVFRLI